MLTDSQRGLLRRSCPGNGVVALALVVVGSFPGGCCATTHDPHRVIQTEEPVPGGTVGLLDQYLKATTQAERIAIVQGIVDATPESRRVLALAFNCDEPEVSFAAVGTICDRFADYIPPGSAEGRCLVAAEWLATHP